MKNTESTFNEIIVKYKYRYPYIDDQDEKLLNTVKINAVITIVKKYLGPKSKDSSNPITSIINKKDIYTDKQDGASDFISDLISEDNNIAELFKKEILLVHGIKYIDKAQEIQKNPNVIILDPHIEQTKIKFELSDQTIPSGYIITSKTPNPKRLDEILPINTEKFSLESKSSQDVISEHNQSINIKSVPKTPEVKKLPDLLLQVSRFSLESKILPPKQDMEAQTDNNELLDISDISDGEDCSYTLNYTEKKNLTNHEPKSISFNKSTISKYPLDESSQYIRLQDETIIINELKPQEKIMKTELSLSKRVRTVTEGSDIEIITDYDEEYYAKTIGDIDQGFQVLNNYYK